MLKAILGRILAFWALIAWVVLMLLFFPILMTSYATPDPEGMERFRRISKVWIPTFLFLTGCRFRRRGEDNFKKGEIYIVVVNHNSFLDIPLSTPAIPGPNKTIAKIELSRIPIFGLIYKRGSVLVDRKNPDSRKESYRAMKGVLAKGMHMCIYAEGSRNRTTRPLKEFQDGAFRLSADTGVSIIPALIFNTREVLPANKPFFFWPKPVEMHFLPPVSPEGLDYKALKDKVHGIMEAYYVGKAAGLAGGAPKSWLAGHEPKS